MTTVKEFEELKQEIAIKLNGALSAMLELKPNLASNIVADQIKAIHKLQPPHPTCNSCSNYQQLYTHAGSCNKDVGNHWIISENKYTSLVDDDFGCIHHSGLENYGGVKNA